MRWKKTASPRAAGLQATNFAAVKSFAIDDAKPVASPLTAAQIQEKNTASADGVMDYQILKAAKRCGKIEHAFCQGGGLL